MIHKNQYNLQVNYLRQMIVNSISLDFIFRKFQLKLNIKCKRSKFEEI